jgi:hypothetical protein
MDWQVATGDNLQTHQDFYEPGYENGRQDRIHGYSYND